MTESLYVYIWKINKDVLFKYSLPDIKKAQQLLLKDVYKLCIDHEKAYYYVKYTRVNTNHYYTALEDRIRFKLCAILCTFYDMSIDEANKKVDNCYNYGDYSIIHRTINKFIENSQPIIEI
jgi:hypothetical protein